MDFHFPGNAFTAHELATPTEDRNSETTGKFPCKFQGLACEFLARHGMLKPPCQKYHHASTP
jgi:hypothetical protein